MNSAIQRNLERADDLVAFMQGRDPVAVVIRFSEDDEDRLASVRYECNRVVLEPAGTYGSRISKLESTINDLEEEIIDLKRERDLLRDKLNKIKKAVELT